jgi:hypothetical protein
MSWHAKKDKENSMCRIVHEGIIPYGHKRVRRFLLLCYVHMQMYFSVAEIRHCSGACPSSS